MRFISINTYAIRMNKPIMTLADPADPVHRLTVHDMTPAYHHQNPALYGNAAVISNPATGRAVTHKSTALRRDPG